VETIVENEIVWLKQGLSIEYWALRLQRVLEVLGGRCAYWKSVRCGYRKYWEYWEGLCLLRVLGGRCRNWEPWLLVY